MSGAEAPLAPWKHVISGGTAGVIELCLLYPTDVLKTRIQLSTSEASMATVSRGILSTQGPAGFYRGIAAPIMAEAPKRAWKFTANEGFKRQFTSRHPEGKLTSFGAIASGSLAGISEALINCPFETVKVRMQAKENLRLFKSSTECAMAMLKNEGITSLYKGLEPQMWRNGLWNGAYFGIIGIVQAKVVVPADAPKSRKLLNKFLAGVVGSSVGTMLNTPFDVAKSRMQQQQTRAGETVKYRHAFQAIAVVQREEGFAALYKGFGARMLRLGPGGGIMIVAFDKISSLLR